MNDLENMSIKDILGKIGICLMDNDINMIFGTSKRGLEAIKKLGELYQGNLLLLKDMRKSQDLLLAKASLEDDTIHELNKIAVEQVLVEYEDIVNKRLFVLVSTYNSYERYGNEKNNGRRRFLREKVDAGLRLLGSKNYTVVIPKYDKEADSIYGMKIINLTELINAIKNGKSIDAFNNSNKKKIARLKDIDRKILLKNIIQIVRPEDLRYIFFTNEDVGLGVLYESIYNATIEYKKNYPELGISFDWLGSEEGKDDLESISQSNEYYTAVENAIMQNSKYLDIDKMLLVAAYRYIERLEGFEDINSEKQINQIRDLLGQIYEEIKEGTKIEGIVNDEEDERVYFEYSLELLKNDLLRFVDGRYIRKSESEELKQRLLANEVKLDEVNKEELRLIPATGEELFAFARNSDDNAIYLIREHIIHEEEIMVLLYELGTCSERLFMFCCEGGMLNTEDIIELFEEGIIKADYISKIQNGELLRTINSFGKERLKELYQEIYSEEKNDDETSFEFFNKYVNLYKALNLAGKSEEELFDEAFNLISSFDDIDSDMLQELYQFGLIPLEAAADWGVNLIDMLSDNSIKPTDLKKLYGKDIINIDNIRNVILHGSLLYEEKLDLIYSTFDGDSEAERGLREELVELLETGESYRNNSNARRGKISNEHTIRSREFITDPHARWKLISLLDKDYSKKFLPSGKQITDGHRVFLLPNQDKIVIEKMHEKRNGRKVSAYGSATYIMDTEEFFKSMESIIVDGAINRTALRELYEAKKSEKIAHTKNWGEYVKKYFGIGPENDKYTEEDIIAIDKAILSVVNSRKERE